MVSHGIACETASTLRSFPPRTFNCYVKVFEKSPQVHGLSQTDEEFVGEPQPTKRCLQLENDIEELRR